LKEAVVDQQIKISRLERQGEKNGPPVFSPAGDSENVELRTPLTKKGKKRLGNLSDLSKATMANDSPGNAKLDTHKHLNTSDMATRVPASSEKRALHRHRHRHRTHIASRRTCKGGKSPRPLDFDSHLPLPLLKPRSPHPPLHNQRNGFRCGNAKGSHWRRQRPAPAHSLFSGEDTLDSVHPHHHQSLQERLMD
jgi:hypothetical protein